MTPWMPDPLASPLLMQRSTVDDCLEALHSLGAAREPVSLPVVARWLGVTAALGAVMMGEIAARGLAEHSAAADALLTPRGRQEAARVVRRRRLVESLLTASYGYPLDAAQTIAARLANAIPSGVVDHAARVFGEPDLTPRAEPAPAWALAMREYSARGEDAASDADGAPGSVAPPADEPGGDAVPRPFRWPTLPLARGESNA